MATLDDLYRARRGHQNEQVENFLSAATGPLLHQNPAAARAFLGLYHHPGVRGRGGVGRVRRG